MLEEIKKIYFGGVTMKATRGLIVLLLIFAIFTAGCSTSNNSANDKGATGANNSKNNTKTPVEEKKEPVEISLAMWDSNDDFIQYLTEKVKEYTDVQSHVTVEVTPFKDDGTYLQNMKVRLSANDLPDIIQLKPNFINDFKEELLPLNNENFAAKNNYAASYAIDEQIYAVPNTSFPELVYYHPSIFEELNLEIPTTWPQFIELLQTIKEDGKYIPYSLGGKDAWTNYPFNEFMPLLESGNENYLSDMANEDHPFANNTAFYSSFAKINDLFKADVMGPDPLGIGWDQATVLFEAKEAAVIAAGLWYLASYEGNVGSTEDLAAFPLPYRDTEAEPLKVMTFTDHFYGVNKNSENVDEVTQFLEWFYSPEVYQTYVDKIQLGSTIEGVQANVPFLTDFYANNDVEAFNYLPGNEQQSNIANSIQLDWKNIGQEMMAGRDLDEMSNELNEKWAKAKKSLQ